MITELIRFVNYFPGIFQRANQIRDKTSGAPVDVNSLMEFEKMIKRKLGLPFIVHACLLTHLSRLGFPTVINWTSPFSF